MNLVPIDGQQNLVRDVGSKAILNNNTKELAKYQEQTRILNQNKNVASRVDKLEDDISKIKTMLELLLLKDNK